MQLVYCLQAAATGMFISLLPRSHLGFLALLDLQICTYYFQKYRQSDHFLDMAKDNQPFWLLDALVFHG